MPVEKYGVTFPDAEAGVDPSASIELAMAFRQECFAASGWLGRYQHLRNAIDLLYNEPRRRYAAKHGIEYDPRKQDTFIWNDWTELMMETFCEWHWATTVTGPNAAWKTMSASVYGTETWHAAPAETIVVITSTSLPGLRRRIWKEMTKLYRMNALGHFNATDFAIRFEKGSDAAGIFGIATGQEEGDVEKAINKIIGFHARYVCAIVDEMQATNEAIVKACVSLQAGAERFQFIGLGNADSELDAHGQMSEPVNGWSSISDTDEKWETKRGVCIHLDGLESPRVKDGDEFYPGLLKQSDIDDTIRDYGEDSPEFWSKRRGFWAPQGVAKTVFTAAMITKFKAREKAIWVGEFVEGLALDPAFEGGDRCMLRVLRCGTIDGGITVIAPVEKILVKLRASSEEPIHYQIVAKVKEIAAERGIPANMIGIDSTGEGGGLLSIMVREIGAGILGVEFGGRATSDPVSETNPKPANQEYYNRATQLWFFLRTLLMNGQVRDLDMETATELCKRPRDTVGSLTSIRSKSKMPGKSPDLADALVVGAWLFYKRGLIAVGSGLVTTSSRSPERWRELAKKYDVTSDYLVA